MISHKYKFVFVHLTKTGGMSIVKALRDLSDDIHQYHSGVLSPEWKKNCESERLLGVSLTGYYDNKIVRDVEVLKDLRNVGIKTNKKYAKRFKVKE